MTCWKLDVINDDLVILFECYTNTKLLKL
uniref:Uncharacterized protein n=1 Tax=Arundo donax TaxID=35708 RepID=A0A0A9FXM7_ARUDO